jgi:microsomal dipeptidase-like Zn-dependent dipeptidase
LYEQDYTQSEIASREQPTDPGMDCPGEGPPMKDDTRRKHDVDSDNSADPEFIKNLATHGLTGEEMKKILEGFRVKWWKKDEDDSGNGVR